MTTTAGVLKITDSDDSTYTVTQIEEPSTLPKVVNDGDRKEISFDVGVVEVNSARALIL